MFSFQLEAQSTSTHARAATIVTAHGEIQTPIFMPVGTRASVKTLDQNELEELGAQIILGNTYHLELRPGSQLIEKVSGGLHGFMSWGRPILTDSGGFQVFSLAQINKVTDRGVEFQSHIDGQKVFIGPQESMTIQKQLGSDIVMVFDECPKLPISRDELQKSLDRTHRWARECRDFKLKEHQALFGIIQGGLEQDLRKESLEILADMNFEGLAIGGLSVGEAPQDMHEMVEYLAPLMPSEKPRYLMGVGKPLDLLEAIKSGIDMFDCVLPTRNARNGQFLTGHGPLNIKKERFKYDTEPPDPDCACKVCQKYHRSYLRHLYLVGEPTVGRLISFHNLWFYMQLVKRAREAILKDQFDEYYSSFYKRYTSQRWA